MLSLFLLPLISVTDFDDDDDDDKSNNEKIIKITIIEI